MCCNRGIRDRDAVHIRPLKWKCTKECRLLSSDEVDLVLRYSKHEFDNLGSGCNYMSIMMTPLNRQSKPALVSDKSTSDVPAGDNS